MLKYIATNWKSPHGLQTNWYDVTFNWIKSQATVQEQRERPERLSLESVYQRRVPYFFDICVTL